MRRWLKREPNTIFRILHSTAKYHNEIKLTGKEGSIGCKVGNRTFVKAAS
jgi:hypothetical protein